MKKFYALLGIALIGFSINANAYTDPTVDLTDSTCWQFENYKISKNFDFINWQLNGEALDEWAQSSDAADFQCYNTGSAANVNMYQVTTTGLTFMYVQDSNVYHRTNRVTGVFAGANNRLISLAGMKKDQIIMIQGGSTTTTTFDDGAFLSYAEGEEAAVEITDSIHALQAAETDPDTGEAKTADAFHYYKMVKDGRFDLLMVNGNYISVMLIYNCTLNPEFVTMPSFEMKAVDYGSRMMAVIPGESSYANDVIIYYSLNDDDPIYRDETGNPTQEGGEWGDYYYDAELGADAWIAVNESDDEDGDGYVKVNAACITAEGVVSDVASMNVAVGAITLNAPTLTLSGIDGIDRSYTLDWTNNTLCKETYTFNVELDGDNYYGEYTTGDVLTAHNSIKVTVVVEGYYDGVAEEEDLVMEGIDVTRKNTEKATEGKHDWDFLSDDIDEATLQKIENLYVIGGYYKTEDGDSTWYTREQIEAGGDDVPTEVVEVVGYYNWTYDSAKSRTWLDVYAQDSTVSEDGTVTYSNYTHKEDVTGLSDGLVFDQTITANSSGAYPSGIAIYTNNIGMYFMRKTTVSIPNLNYGEYVMVHHGKGGSNYVTSEWNTCEMVDVEWDEELQQNVPTYSFSKNADFLQWIDIYTYNDLPDAIATPKTNTTNGHAYNLAGQLVGADYKGIVIQNGKKYLR